MPIKLTPRLMTAVPYIRGGRLVADIGTDHAYLPIYLCEQRRLTPVATPNGETICAIAADINKGPVERADEHIAAARLSRYVKTVQTDGLTGLDVYDPADIIIFGMGGELIMRILQEAPWVKNKAIGLVLQPMSRGHLLRQWLCENGFRICGEAISDTAKFYQTIYARYDGVGESYTEEELLLGKRNIEGCPPLFEGFVRHEIAVHQRILEGKQKSSDADASDELRAIGFLTKRLEKIL